VFGSILLNFKEEVASNVIIPLVKVVLELDLRKSVTEKPPKVVALVLGVGILILSSIVVIVVSSSEVTPFKELTFI
jgi:hypothetical protein